MHVAPPAILIVVVPTGVTVLLGLHNCNTLFFCKILRFAKIMHVTKLAIETFQII
jgi:hypothetical protein